MLDQRLWSGTTWEGGACVKNMGLGSGASFHELRSYLPVQAAYTILRR